jgi:hypothetical protein
MNVTQAAAARGARLSTAFFAPVILTRGPSNVRFSVPKKESDVSRAAPQYPLLYYRKSRVFTLMLSMCRSGT